MNPEFRRNLWLEMPPRRLLPWAVVLGLAFFAAAVSDRSSATLGALARFLFYVQVVFWGSRNAALSVAGEIRDRTWDAQRLSSISALDMSWGKLFGATIFNWYLGAICLAVIFASDVAADGLGTALVGFVYYIEIGLIAQASALLASLIAVRRRQVHTRGEIFLYQLAGIFAAIAVYGIWELADPAGTLFKGVRPAAAIAWWGQLFEARGFLLVSLALFTAWVLIGCWRQMRTELQIANGPSVWLGFLVFIGLYTAGFDGWLDGAMRLTGADALALRLALAATAFAVLTYLTVLFEPKDRVHLRWLGSQLVAGRLGKLAAGLQPYMLSYLAVVLTTLTLMGWLAHAGAGTPGEIAMIGAGLGFVTRDAGLFLFVHAARGRQRADAAALLVLAALYVFIPAILNASGAQPALAGFYPQPTEPVWLTAIIAWAEALVVAAAALRRIALPESPAPQGNPAKALNRAPV